MPPMPPPPPPPIGIAGLSFGTSATIASVVIRRPATEGRVLQRGAHDLRRIDDAGLDHVDRFFGLGVEDPVYAPGGSPGGSRPRPGFRRSRRGSACPKLSFPRWWSKFDTWFPRRRAGLDVDIAARRWTWRSSAVQWSPRNGKIPPGGAVPNPPTNLVKRPANPQCRLARGRSRSPCCIAEWPRPQFRRPEVRPRDLGP
jgi:hypothetical protein